MPSTDAPAIHCSIEVGHQKGSVSLRGRIVSPTATRGDYRLEIQSQGPFGSSDVSQAGRFDGESEVPVIVGLVNLSMASGTRLVARLIVQSTDARSCRAEKQMSAE